jgi:hypothetical protein
VPDGTIPFKFHCRKCGDGYLSTFQTNTLSTAAGPAGAGRPSAYASEAATAWPEDEEEVAVQASSNDERRAT